MWFKGCFHIHTTNSEGELEPIEACNWYKNNKYNFIAFTDHNIITRLNGRHFKNFLIIENSIEFSNFGTDLHILGIGLNEYKLSIPCDYQSTINYILKKNGLAVIAHPNWNWAGKFSQLLQLENYHGIEIFNSFIKQEKCGSSFATEKWDYLLSLGNKIWGFAVDDMHMPANDLIGQGWIMVKANNLEKEEIMNSIRQGDFYSTTGVIIKDIYFDKNKYLVESLNGEEIIFIADYGRIVKVIDDSRAALEINDKYKYIRCEIRSGEGIAYTQPVFF